MSTYLLIYVGVLSIQGILRWTSNENIATSHCMHWLRLRPIEWRVSWGFQRVIYGWFPFTPPFVGDLSQKKMKNGGICYLRDPFAQDCRIKISSRSAPLPGDVKLFQNRREMPQAWHRDNRSPKSRRWNPSKLCSWEATFMACLTSMDFLLRYYPNDQHDRAHKVHIILLPTYSQWFFQAYYSPKKIEKLDTWDTCGEKIISQDLGPAALPRPPLAWRTPMSREIERDDIGGCQLLPEATTLTTQKMAPPQISGAQVPGCLHMGTHIHNIYIHTYIYTYLYIYICILYIHHIPPLPSIQTSPEHPMAIWVPGVSKSLPLRSNSCKP